MTAQINDTFRYDKREYDVAGISEGELFNPVILDLKPAATCTACWRGYQAVFGLSHSRLVLDALGVNLLKPGKGYQREEGPVINGVNPIAPKGKHQYFNNHYEGLNYHLEYTGGLLLAEGFIRELYVHMGFHPAWKYDCVVELVFDSGVLKQELDRSQQMAEIRQRIKDQPRHGYFENPLSRDEIRQFIHQAFERRYRM